MTGALPDLGDFTPNQARLVMRVTERAGEIIEAHVPDPSEPTPEISPMATIKVETLAHLTALIRLHYHGATFHTARGNRTQATLWNQDAERLEAIFRSLVAIPIN